MQNHVSYINHILRMTKNVDLMSVYLSVALRMFAFSLVGVFVPIYFLKELGFSLNEVMLYHVLWALITLLITPFVAKLIVKIGFKKSMLLSAPLAVMYLLLLHLMRVYDIHYFWSAFLSALSMQLYWMGFHVSFANSSDKKKRGEEISLWYTILMVVGLLGPIAGGVMIHFLGFKMLFIVASLIMVLSALPIFLNKQKVKQKDFSIMSVLNVKLKDFAVYVAYGIKEIANSLVWPLFVFLLLQSEIQLGAIASAVSLAGSVFSLVVGRMTDHHVKQGMLKKLGSLIDGVSWPFRILLTSFNSILAVSVASYMGFLLVDIPLYRKFYDGVKEHTEYIVTREIALATGRMIAVIAVMILGFYASFWLIGLSNIAYSLL